MLKQTVKRKSAIKVVSVFDSHHLAAKNKPKNIVFKHIQWICVFSESKHHYLLIVLCDLWSFTKEFRHQFLLHLLHQTLKQTQILCSYIFKEICYFRVEIPFGNNERFLADPISFAPFPFVSDWGESFFFLFLSYSRISLIRWLDEFFAAWKSRVEFIIIMSFPTFKFIAIVAVVQLNLMLFDLPDVILPAGSDPQTRSQ